MPGYPAYRLVGQPEDRRDRIDTRESRAEETQRAVVSDFPDVALQGLWHKRPMSRAGPGHRLAFSRAIETNHRRADRAFNASSR